MKKTIKNIIGLFLLACGTLSAEIIDLSMPDAWNESKKISWSNGTITTTGRIRLSSVRKFPVDPAKKYTFSYKVKASKSGNWMLGGFQAYDAKGRLIQSCNVNAVPDSMTTVAKNAPKGSQIIYLKDASKWKNYNGASIVTGAKADFSDLPNFNIAAVGFKSVEKDGDLWKVVLRKPLAQPLDANTSVRLHLPAGALYTCGITYVSNSWTRMKGTIKGGTDKPGYSYFSWPVGTVSGEAVILINWKNLPDMTTELEELKLEIE